MPNSDPYHARMAKKRRGKPGNLQKTQQVLWHAIVAAEVVLDTAETNQQILQVCHALAQACTAYNKLLETGELEARLAHLEAQLTALKEPHGS